MFTSGELIHIVCQTTADINIRSTRQFAKILVIQKDAKSILPLKLFSNLSAFNKPTYIFYE